MPEPAPELWTTEQAAEHLGILPKSASGLFSRRGIKRADEGSHPVSGRTVALWHADEVRTLVTSRRPGTRTDLIREEAS